MTTVTTLTPHRGIERTRRTQFPTMGTVASLRIDDIDDATVREAGRRVEAECARWEDEFSRWNPTSPASKIADGTMKLRDASTWHRTVYADAIDWRNRTGGAFDPHTPDGTIDLAGIVKALAIQEAGHTLLDLGCENWCLNVGGDVLTSGLAHGQPWTVGLVDPTDRNALWRVVTLTDGQHAVATSGTTERGEHIWRPHTEAAVRQCSVIAADIVTADVLATAIVAAGRTFAESAVREHGVSARIAFDDGTELHLCGSIRANRPEDR